MKVTKNIDIYLTNKRPVKVIDVVQGDTGIQLVFTLKDFTIPNGSKATLYVQKPSGKFVYQNDNITVADNTITIDLENQALTEYGEIPYQVSIENGADTITTFTGIMIVQPSLKDSGAIKSGTVVRAFDELTVEKLAEFQERAETAANGVIATIPEDYTEMTAKVNESANAIKGNLSGAVVRADDVSPVEHSPSVKVHGKNLFNTVDIATTEATGDNVYISEVGAGYVVVTTVGDYDGNGYCRSFKTLQELCPQIEVGKTYILNATTEPVAWLKCIYFINVGFWYFNKPLTITEEMLSSEVVFYGLNTMQGQGVGSCKILNIQLEEGDTATEYTPYVDPSTVTVTRCGKNLFFVGEATINGVTLTKSGDNYILNGTCTDSAVFQHPIGFLPEGLYTLSANNPKNNGIELALLQVYDSSQAKWITAYDNANNSKASVYLNASNNYYCRIRIEKSVVYNNFIIRPQFEVGEIATDFEAYKEPTEYTPVADGTINGLTSVSPTMTLLTDTEGVTIECEYNKDTNKVISKLVNAISAMGGEVTI